MSTVRTGNAGPGAAAASPATVASVAGSHAGLRVERDLLGEREIPAGTLYGIHTVRALENFPLAGRPVHEELIRAYGTVKLACARTNRALGVWAEDPAKADAIERACRDLAEGRYPSTCWWTPCRAAPAPAPT